MSFLLGTTAGALVAGGVYYGLSNLIHGRTAQHRADLKSLGSRLEGADTIQPAPLSAASRVRQRPFLSQLQTEWNSTVEQLFHSSSTAGESISDWGRRAFNEATTKRA